MTYFYKLIHVGIRSTSFELLRMYMLLLRITHSIYLHPISVSNGGLQERMSRERKRAQPDFFGFEQLRGFDVRGRSTKNDMDVFNRWTTRDTIGGCV